MIAALSYAIELHVLMSQTEFFECPTLFLSITQISAPKSFFKFSTFFSCVHSSLSKNVVTFVRNFFCPIRYPLFPLRFHGNVSKIVNPVLNHLRTHL